MVLAELKCWAVSFRPLPYNYSIMKSSKTKQKQKPNKPPAPKQSKDLQVVDVPAARSITVRQNNPPQFKSVKEGGLRIRHKEYSSVLFANYLDARIVNPGNADLFPWMSRIANSFENYRFRHIKVIYVPSAPTSTNGSLIMAFDPDAQDASDTQTQQQLMSFKHATETPIWKETTMSITSEMLNPVGPKKFISHGNETGLNYMSGIIYGLPAVTGMADGTKTGRLWVEYDVVLENPTAESFLANGGTWTGAGSGTGFLALASLTPAAGSGRFKFVRNTGLYQGLQSVVPGSYLVTFRVIVDGGGVVASMDPSAYSNGTIVLLAEYEGTAVADSSFIWNANTSDAILNFAWATTGTITAANVSIHIGQAPIGSLVNI